MRFRVCFGFFSVLMLLTSSYLVLVNLPISSDFGLTMNASAAPFSGGNGSVNNPFKISDASELQNMSLNLSANYILINDIDATETAAWNFGSGFARIGSSSTKFTGTLDGKGFKIYNLTVNRSGVTYCGMFGYTSSGFKLTNLTLINPWISGMDYTGIVGFMGGGNISFVTVLNTTISGRYICGGLVAHIEASATVKNSSSNGTVSGDRYIGGFTGFSQGTIEQCYSSCYVYNSGNFAGGFTSYNFNDNIRNCYATGDVFGDRWVGGFTGYGRTSIKNCYSLGKPIGNLEVGGFVGGAETYAHIACFWDKDSSGTSTGWGSGTPTGITGNTNTEMKVKSIFLNAGWDFNNIWYMINGGTPPFLQSLGADNGKGTKFYPFLIEDIYELQAMNENLNAHYALVNDIDASETHKWNWNGTAYQGFKPIAPDTDPGTSGFQGPTFKGTFSGNEKTIQNLFINRPDEDYIGLFGDYYSTPGPFNVSLIECNITGNDNVGGLMGVSYVGATTDKCYVSGIVRGNWNVGGMIGYCRYHIRNSNSNCIVNGYSRVGGLVGYFIRGTSAPIIMTNCYTSGTVTGEDYLGGLVGYGNDPYFVRRCYSISAVKAEGSTPQYSGSLIGYNGWGTVENCYSTGSVKGGNYAGGFIGSNFNGVVLNCSSSGYVSGNPTVGGFIGYNQTSGSGIIERCFFDTQTSGTSSGFGFGSSSEVVGQTTTQMITKTTFTNAGWDFNNVWYMSSYGTRPFLRMEHNTTVRTDHQLQMMDMDPTASYTLANDIDMSPIKDPAQMWGTSESSGPGFAPIGTFSNKFTGNFYGNDRILNGMFINRTTQSYIGLFGFTQGAIIKNIFLNDFEITGQSLVGSLTGDNSNGGTWENITCKGDVTATNHYAGSLAGGSTSKITNCSSYGNVNGISNVGGLVGYTGSPGAISKSFSRVNVIGSGSYIGGLVGHNLGTISDSYTFSNIKGNDKVGGLVGENSDTVTNCYSIGNVTGSTNVGGLIGLSAGSDTNCIWNPETSGISWSAGGTGKTTTQMMQKATYSNWDFNNVWGIIDGYSFPYLKWQYLETPQAVSGIAYSDFGNDVGLGKSVDLVQNGKHVMVETTYSNGFYYFLVENNTFTSNDGMIVRFVNESIKGNTVFLANKSDSMKNLELYNSTLTVISGSGAIMNYSIIEQARGFLTTDIVYRAFGDKLNLLTIDFILDKDTTFELDGNFIATIISESYFYGHLILNSDVSFEGWRFYFYNFTGTHSLDINGSAYFNENVGDTSKPKDIMVKKDTFFHCDYVNTTGNQRYSQMVLLYKDLSMSTATGNGNIFFESSLDSIGTPFKFELEAGTGNIAFNKTVGGYLWTMGDIVVNSVHDLNIEKDFHAQSFTQNSGTGTTDLGMSSVNLSSGPAIFKCNDVVGNITAGALSLKVNTANLTGKINGYSGQAGADEIVLLNVIKKGTQFFDGIDLYPFDIKYSIIATEDSQYNVNYKTEYPIYAGYSWSMDTNAGSWLIFDAGTAVLSGIPTNADVGTCWVNVTVNDGDGGVDWHYFNLMVNNVAPNITTPNPTNATMEDALYSFDFDSSDDGQGSITWSLQTSAGWLSINSTTGVLSGTPTNDQLGDWWVNVTVDDGNGGLASYNYSIHVDNVNDPPEITATIVNNTLEDQLFTLDFDATDIDPTSDIFTWTLHTNAAWLSLNSSTGILSGTPENKDVGSYWVNITVNDGNGGSHWVNFTLIVLNVNDPPKIWTDIVDITTANKLFSVDYEASDIDPTNDTLSWSLFTNATWLSIDSVTGLLSGTSTENDVGIYWVNVTVSDGNGGFDWQNFSLKVQSAGIINNNPVITTQNVLSVIVIRDYEVTYSATDDRTPVNLLIWAMNTNATWLEFDNSTRILSGTPQEKDIGSYWVNITVSDGEGGLAFTNFTLTVKKLVKPTNKNPILTNGKMTPSSGNIDTEFTFTVTYTDADNDPGEVYVWIDGKQQNMSQDQGDTDYTDGVEYSFKTKLSKGTHKYYFTASDGSDSAIAGDDTPITAEDATATAEIEDEDGDDGDGEKDEGGMDWLMLLMLLIVIIIIILLLVSIFGRRGKEAEPAAAFAEEEAEEPMDMDEEDLEDEDLDEIEEPEFDEELEDDEEPDEDEEDDDEAK